MLVTWCSWHSWISIICGLHTCIFFLLYSLYTCILIYPCLHWSWKAPMGSGHLRLHFFSTSHAFTVIGTECVDRNLYLFCISITGTLGAFKHLHLGILHLNNKSPLTIVNIKPTFFACKKNSKCSPITAFFRSVSASFSTTFCFCWAINSFVFSPSLIITKA